MKIKDKNKRTCSFRIRCICAVLMICTSPLLSGILDEHELRYLKEGLDGYAITLDEIEFDKQWTQDDSFRLQIVSRLMNHPLEVPEFVAHEGIFCDSLRFNTISNFIVHAAGLLDVQLDEINHGIFQTKTKHAFSTPALSDSLSQAISIILKTFDNAQPFIRRFQEKLSDDEIEHLLVNGPIIWADDDDSLEADSLKGILYKEQGLPFDTTDLGTDTLFEYIEKLNRKDLLLASMILQRGLEDALRILTTQLSDDLSRHIILDTTTLYGRIVIGGKDTNVYDGEYTIIIDVGGDDNYRGRCGSGIGILHNPFSVVIDLSGDDVYSSQQVCNFGSGFFGCGVLIDLQGNDVYRGHHNSIGAGSFGTGVVIDKDGADIYEAGYFSEGAAFVGTGILYDGGGDDMLRGFDWTQGFGSIFGYGLVMNSGGDDVYTAGGRYIHHPLRPHDHRSFAQGFAMGLRPDASGGIGFLYDTEGNDFYNAEIFAQGASYWYSLGMLFDKKGNDYYNACQYAQGSGIHLSVGMLLDTDGHDHYFSRHGPSQGEGHDLAVGILIDKKGNDSYLVSGGQGVGLSNSCGIFVDAEGNDIYASREALGEGSANSSRGFGGLGVFLDIGGRDTYPKSRSGSDETIWQDGSYGLGIDVESIHEPEEETYPQRDTLEADVPVEEVFEAAAEWGVVSNETRVNHARKRLKEMAMEAIVYVIENKMETKSGLEMRAIEDLATEYPDSIEPFLLDLLRDDADRRRRNSIYLLGKIKSKTSIDSLIAILEEKRNKPYRGSILYTFGEIEDDAATPVIIPYLNDTREKIRILAAEALGKIEDSSAIQSLIVGLQDPLFTVRLACENSIVKIGAPSIGPLLTDTESTTETAELFHVISALGRLAKEQDTVEQKRVRLRIKKTLIPYLDSEEKALRSQAVKALALFNDQSINILLKDKMVYETDLFVIGAYLKYVVD